MNTQEINWVKDCLPTQMVYPYFKDKFALELLDLSFEDETPISTIKQSRFGKLLNRPAVKEVTAQCGDGKLNKNAITNYWGDETHFLRLTLGEWGYVTKKKRQWYQVSRPQKNLVLQVNFDGNHDQAFYRYMGEENKGMFDVWGHPGSKELNTLGWVRMDICMDRGEVLIEEVQSDWVKRARRYPRGPQAVHHHPGLRTFEWYHRQLKPYLKMWEEMLLSAAIYFIAKQLGLSNIWYHTFESGKHYKMMPQRSLPPRSVYTKLPEKFGFEKVHQTPDILTSCPELKNFLRRGREVNFYQLKF
ncbi:MAG: hypothetical protein JJ975_07005 [Bacteroidia bacterium]|nr:hypothetical protein [Bacteroidia bacterium]